MEYDCIHSTQIGTVSLMKLHLEQGFNVLRHIMQYLTHTDKSYYSLLVNIIPDVAACLLATQS